MGALRKKKGVSQLAHPLFFINNTPVERRFPVVVKRGQKALTALDYLPETSVQLAKDVYSQEIIQ